MIIPLEIRTVPNVEIPLTFKVCASKLVVVVIPSVEIPVILRSVNVFGAFAIALSIVAVVVESSEAMF